MKIKATFTTEYGRFDSKLNKFVDKYGHTEYKVLEMRVVLKMNLPILEFIGGPTGFETYYLEDLRRSNLNNGNNEFCICGGTINKWPRCIVNKKEVFDFIDIEMEKYVFADTVPVKL